MLVAWVIYALMFGPTARVAIEDAYSGAVRVVDNVPLGPAAIGSVMSNVGYGVTRLFEQAFSTPAMTDQGFADPLQTLMSVRKGTLSRIALGAANSPTAGADVERSFVNYVADCTLYDVDIGTRSMDAVLRDPNWETALKSNLDAPTTELVLGANPQLLPCDQAWTTLSEYTAVDFIPALVANLQAEMRLAAPGDVTSKVQFALDAIAGAGVDAQNYMVMAAMVGFLEKGIVQTHENLGKWELAATTEQAAAQRNAQWAAEETLFTRIVRPMMTFFEGFLYAISPLMAFAIALGSGGDRHGGQVPALRPLDSALDADPRGDQPVSQHGDHAGSGCAAVNREPRHPLHPLPLQARLSAAGLSGHRRDAGGEHPGDQSDADLRERHHGDASGRAAAGRGLHRREDHVPRRGASGPGPDAEPHSGKCAAAGHDADRRGHVLWRADVGTSLSRDQSSKARFAAEASAAVHQRPGLGGDELRRACRGDLRGAGHGAGATRAPEARPIGRSCRTAEGLAHRYAESGLSAPSSSPRRSPPASARRTRPTAGC